MNGKELIERLEMGDCIDRIYFTKSVYITSHLAERVGKALMKCNGITMLNMSGGSIKDEAVKVLSSGLTFQNNLKILDLSRNRIGDEGVQSICEVMETCKHLKTVMLWKNPITNKGIRYLGDSLLRCPHILSLNVGSSSIEDGSGTLKRYLKRNCTLTELVVPCKKEGKEWLRTQLALNRLIHRMSGRKEKPASYLTLPKLFRMSVIGWLMAAKRLRIVKDMRNLIVIHLATLTKLE